MMDIYQKLGDYSKKDLVPMHMPGHKRKPLFAMGDPYRIDVTEVEGTDDLHCPRGIIREQMDEIKSLYGTRESYLLVNGSTCGILAAVSACCRRGDRILMDRNCHRSVYHAVYLLELKPVYLYREEECETGILLGLSREEVEKELDGDFSCVILTSPTYEGIVSDIAGIADVVHRQDIPLIVDQAHGAHLSWWTRARQHEKAADDASASHKEIVSATAAGADLVVESLHKTLPALTQTGLLHICSNRIGKEQVERYLDIYETSSPSYVLMASISQCIHWMAEESGKYFSEYEKKLAVFAEKASKWKSLRLWGHWGKEPSKLVVCTPFRMVSGVRLAEMLLREYGIQVEMAAPGYVIAMTSLCDTEESFSRLSDALEEIDRQMGRAGDRKEAGARENPRQISGGSAARKGTGILGSGIRPSGHSAAGGAAAREGTGILGSGIRPSGHSVSGSSAARAATRTNAYSAINAPWEKCVLEDSRDRISAEYAFIYPPGIPFLVPGEEITGEVLDKICSARELGLKIAGLQDENAETIRVLRSTY